MFLRLYMKKIGVCVDLRVDLRLLVQGLAWVLNFRENGDWLEGGKEGRVKGLRKDGFWFMVLEVRS